MKIRVWPNIIFVLLGMNFVIVAITVVYATNDKSFAVVHDSYNTALAWDESKKLQAESDALGWTVRVVAVPTGATMALRVLASDERNTPIDDATVNATIFHSAHAGERGEYTFKMSHEGAYESPLPRNHGGEWNIYLRVEHDGDEYIGKHTVFVLPSSVSGSKP